MSYIKFSAYPKVIKFFSLYFLPSVLYVVLLCSMIHFQSISVYSMRYCWPCPSFCFPTKIQLFQHHFLNRQSFSHWIGNFIKNQLTLYFYPILFQRSLCLSLCHGIIILIATALWFLLISSNVSPPGLFFSKFLAILDSFIPQKF